MKAENPSLALLCAVSFLFYSVLLILTYTGVQYCIDAGMQTAFPMMEDFLRYEPELREEAYQEIPLRKFRGSSFIIFSETGTVVYASDADVKEKISASELHVIPDSGSDLYYTIYEQRQGDILFYRIIESAYDPETGFFSLRNSCTLDQNLRLVEGTLFAEKGGLTEREFSFLQGYFSADRSVSKYAYETAQAKKRILVFFSPRFTDRSYNALLSSARRKWLLLIPAVLAGTLCFTFLLHRRIRKGADVLKQTIRSFREPGVHQADRKRIPAEFADTVDTLEVLMNRLDAVTQDRQRIIADISHDLRTPLTVISGYARALSSGLVQPEEEERCLQVITERSEHAAAMINELFEYSRLEHPDYSPSMQNTDIAELVREYLAKEYAGIEQSGFHLSADLPEEAVMMETDSRLFRRILDNLIGNALRSSPPGTDLFVSLKKCGRSIQLVIADNGSGIPPALAARIFEPFVTGDEARHGTKGTGLGLSIVKKAVELHGGTIVLKTAPASAYRTEFRMIFPVSISSIDR